MLGTLKVKPIYCYWLLIVLETDEMHYGMVLNKFGLSYRQKFYVSYTSAIVSREFGYLSAIAAIHGIAE